MSNIKRNRHNRRKSSVYRLESIFRPRPDRSPLSEADLQSLPPHYIDGELEGVKFVSVPETASYNSCEKLRDALDAVWESKYQIVILTHNIELLKIAKLDPGTAAAVIKTIQGDADPSKCELCGTVRGGEPDEQPKESDNDDGEAVSQTH